MSLDNLLNPNDGSMIDEVDSAIFNLNKKIATKWQDKSYRGKEELEKILYFTSTVAFGVYTVKTMDFWVTIPAVLSFIKGKDKNTRPESSLYEQIGCQLVGLPTKTIKYLDVGVYGLGAFVSLVGTGQLVAGAITKDPGLCSDSISTLTLGLGTLSWMSADYMAKCNIGKPPKKPKKKPVSERIKDKIRGLLPNPLPSPGYGIVNSKIKY